MKMHMFERIEIWIINHYIYIIKENLYSESHAYFLLFLAHWGPGKGFIVGEAAGWSEAPEGQTGRKTRPGSLLRNTLCDGHRPLSSYTFIMTINCVKKNWTIISVIWKNNTFKDFAKQRGIRLKMENFIIKKCNILDS